jgi:Ca-activated chloride channel family protein
VATIRPFNPNKSKKKFFGFSRWLILIGTGILIIALARPRFGDEKVVIRSMGIDIVLAIDMSGSMQAMDVPRNVTDGQKLLSMVKNKEVINRLEVAKREIKKFIEARPNDRIGLIGFADLAYSFAPPTLDHDWLIDRLEQLTPGMIGDATGIASPIGSAVNRLKNSTAKRRVLVLFTDGANTAENRLTPEQTAQLAKEMNVVIHTVGIGSKNAFVFSPEYGNRFLPVDGSFDEELMRNIAKITGESYCVAIVLLGMKEEMAKLKSQKKTVIEQPKRMK